MTATRAQVVEEALSWIGTPMAQNQMVKGAGVDCGRLLYAVYQAAGFVPPGDPPDEEDPSGPVTGRYAHDWFANAKSERYLRRAMRYGKLIAETICLRSVKAEPGNVVLTRCVRSQLYNHGGIVVRWPQVVHCHVEVEQICAMDHRLWTHRQIAIFDPWAKLESSST